MISLVLALLSPALAASPVIDGDDPVRILLDQEQRYQPGDRVLVQIETGQTGHLLVLQLSPEGRVRVLFPLSPGDDASVRGGRRYQVRDASSEQSFLTDRAGVGLIYAAISEAPYQLAAFSYENEWDQAVLAIDRATKNPETDLTALVQRMSGPKGFDYDLVSYTVVGPIAVDVESPAWWTPSDTEVIYGEPDCFGCGYWGPGGVYVGIGFGIGWPWLYPWSPYPNGWPYGSYYGGYYPYYPGYYPPSYPGYYPPHYPPGGGYASPWIVGRPRGYQVDPGGPIEPRARGTNVAQAGAPSTEGVTAMAPARRARGGESRGTTPSDGGTVAPKSQPAGTSNGGSAKQPSSSSGSKPSAPATTRARPRGTRSGGDLQAAAAPSRAVTSPPARTTRQWTRQAEWRASRDLAPASPASPRARASGRQLAGGPPPAVAASRSPQARRVTPTSASPRSGPDGRFALGGARSRPQSGSVSPAKAPASVGRSSAPARAPSGGGNARSPSGGGGRARSRP
jgi:hypothetical protein